MARPKSASHELRRDEILDIAAQCFADASYPATSMNTIATAGGTSKARLYHYYDSKEAILFDLLDRQIRRGHRAGCRLRRTFPKIQRRKRLLLM